MFVTVMFLFLFAVPIKLAGAQALQYGQPWTWEIGGEYEVRLDYRKNFALDNSKKDDLLRFDQELQLHWSYRYQDWLAVFLEGKVFGEHELYMGGGPRTSEVELERGETWVRFDNLFGRDLSLKIGRQNFDEPRKWWWDDDLDAIGLRYRQNSWLFEFAVAQDFLPVSAFDNVVEPENEGVTRVLARANWLYFWDHRLDLFFLYQNDRSATPPVGASVPANQEDPSDAKLWWGGLRLSGNQPAGEYGELSYWADVAGVAGNEILLGFSDDDDGNEKLVTSRKKQRVLGWALDVGGRWQLELVPRPVFILGYARGSGDTNPEGKTDRAFQQTRLQSNDEEFRTYGELLRPELSNLQIPVVALQFPVFARSYVEFAYRQFRQLHAAPFLRDGRIEAEPNGIDKNIGQEWMLYALLKQWENVEVELVGAAFRAGSAYGTSSGKMAYSFFTQVKWEF
ncbi:MAG: alginate export family protein [Candidatus Binatia bacterium]